MPASEITAMSVVPPPMSTTMLPEGSVIGSPAPIAAAIAWSTRYTSEALALSAESLTARFSTWVTSEGIADHDPRPHQRRAVVRACG